MTLRDLIRLILHIMHCAQAVKNNNHALNYLYLACPDTFWTQRSNSPELLTKEHFRCNVLKPDLSTYHGHIDLINDVHRGIPNFLELQTEDVTYGLIVLVCFS